MDLGIPATLDMTAPDGEQALMERAKRDRSAFALLYRTHYRPVLRYIHRRTGDPHVTDDLVADVFLIAMQSVGRYRYRGIPVRAWLFGIASNCVNQWARRQRRRALQRLAREPTAGADGRDSVSHATEVARTALLTLAPRYQTVLALHYLEGLSVQEVAAAVGCRIGTVKSRLARGRDQLRRRLSPRRLSS